MARARLNSASRPRGCGRGCGLSCGTSGTCIPRTTRSTMSRPKARWHCQSRRNRPPFLPRPGPSRRKRRRCCLKSCRGPTRSRPMEWCCLPVVLPHRRRGSSGRRDTVMTQSHPRRAQASSRRTQRRGVASLPRPPKARARRMRRARPRPRTRPKPRTWWKSRPKTLPHHPLRHPPANGQYVTKVLRGEKFELPA